MFTEDPDLAKLLRRLGQEGDAHPEPPYDYAEAHANDIVMLPALNLPVPARPQQPRPKRPRVVDADAAAVIAHVVRPMQPDRADDESDMMAPRKAGVWASTVCACLHAASVCTMGVPKFWNH